MTSISVPTDDRAIIHQVGLVFDDFVCVARKVQWLSAQEAFKPGYISLKDKETLLALAAQKDVEWINKAPK